MKEILSKLMAPPAPISITATVIRRLAPGRYELRDGLRRTLQAEAEAIYPPNVDVIVQSGRIVARAGQLQNIKTYEV